MKLFIKAEGIRMNNFPFWLDLKVGSDFELEFLEDKPF
jgi:hypothetical protein